jgi:hypothetical protein
MAVSTVLKWISIMRKKWHNFQMLMLHILTKKSMKIRDSSKGMT